MPIDLAPAQDFQFKSGKGQILLLACGALGREIVTLIEQNYWHMFDVQCLPAKWHNTPHLIVPALRGKIRTAKPHYQKIFVMYGDCGTGGLLDALLAEEGVERIQGPHCYAFFSGNQAFAARADQEVTSFYLTDYLARHFEKLVWQGLGLDRHPDLLRTFFGNYTDLIYLAQTHDGELQQLASQAARKLNLNFTMRYVGYGELAQDMAKLSHSPRRPL